MKKFVLSICVFFVTSTPLSSKEVSRDSLKNRAKILIYDRPDESIKIARQLLKDKNEADETAQLYMLISNAYIAKRNSDSSLFYILKASDLIKTNALPATKIKIMNSVAVQYQQMELYDRAMESLDKAQEMIRNSDITEKDRAYNSGFINAVKGMIYRSQSNPSLALEKFKLAVKEFKKLPLDKKSAANLSIIYYNIGNSYLDLEQLQQATSYFLQSEQYALMYSANSLVAYALKGRGLSLFMSRDYEESVRLLSRAENLAEPVGDLVLSEAIYKILANNHLALNNFEKFQRYDSLYSEAHKTLEKNELKTLNRYLTTESEKIQTQTASSLKTWTLYLWGSVISSLIAAFLLLRGIIRIRAKTRQQNKIFNELAARIQQ